MNNGLQVNDEKSVDIEVNGKHYHRLAIKTPLVTDRDDLDDIVYTYAKPYLRKGDILFISEKMVACTQGRAIPIKDIHPSRLAVFLSGFVRKSAYGIGLSMPETMEMALRECGTLRILLASACGAVGRVFGRKGWFYTVAGYRAATIDGPCPKTIAPYNTCVVLGPLDPDKVAASLAKDLDGVHVLIVDINDLGGNILGSSDLATDPKDYLALLRDNPLGQTDEQTPMGLIRPNPKASNGDSNDRSQHTSAGPQ